MCSNVATKGDHVEGPYINTEEERPGKVNRRRQREVYLGAYLKSLCRPPERINVSHAHKCSVWVHSASGGVSENLRHLTLFTIL